MQDVLFKSFFELQARISRPAEALQVARGWQPGCGLSAAVEVVLEVTVKVRGTVSSRSISEGANECSAMPHASLPVVLPIIQSTLRLSGV